MKIRFLFSGNFWIDGHPRHFEAGAVEDVSFEDAERLIRDKCAEKYIAKPQGKVKNDRKNS